MYEKSSMKRALNRSLRDTKKHTVRTLNFVKKVRRLKNFSSRTISKALWHMESLIDEQFGFADRLRISHGEGFLLDWAKAPTNNENDFLAPILEALYFANRATYLLSVELRIDMHGKQRRKNEKRMERRRLSDHKKSLPV